MQPLLALYDYSCTTGMSRMAADQLDGTFIEMKGIGHFPISENPKVFLQYFSPVLEEISKRGVAAYE
ncbi:hypothetical protein [Cytobacillus purgationiresistens]|uniref:Pimeloyl-ACP methyl ester carboxylesterase n=1 Tax=Cytobacillus purgationiresistens TaxID=863449 RepID=A0ABU0AD71_9BACI|nr:hypothetical protein [Cytobacillus purgationiresistens]MDQ0269204.1 pimeloyl-ACP methyl ester carboxylesterase [Cytobacillus purgationiresistens]